MKIFFYSKHLDLSDTYFLNYQCFINGFSGFFKYIHKVFVVYMNDYDNNIDDTEEGDKNDTVVVFIIFQAL